LTHYVRSGDFVMAMLHDASDINEYAFALGALAHYVADNTGHPLAINLAVPMLYPKLKTRFGDRVTYEDDPLAHIKTEFAFDVLQIARGRYPSQAYRDFIGFEVSKPLLERAFHEVYGLDLNDLFPTLDSSIASYRKSVKKTIPKATKVAWELKKDEIEKNIPGITAEKFIYDYRKPGFGTKMLATLIKIIPKVGPLQALTFHVPTPETEKLFLESFDVTVERYRELLKAEQDGVLSIPDRNFDLGEAPEPGTYKRADDTYAKLVERLAEKDFAEVSPELRANILSYYSDRDAPFSTKQSPKQWQKLVKTLDSKLH